MSLVVDQCAADVKSTVVEKSVNIIPSGLHFERKEKLDLCEVGRQILVRMDCLYPRPEKEAMSEEKRSLMSSIQLVATVKYKSTDESVLLGIDSLDIHFWMNAKQLMGKQVNFDLQSLRPHFSVVLLKDKHFVELLRSPLISDQRKISLIIGLFRQSHMFEPRPENFIRHNVIMNKVDEEEQEGRN